MGKGNILKSLICIVLALLILFEPFLVDIVYLSSLNVPIKNDLYKNVFLSQLMNISKAYALQGQEGVPVCPPAEGGTLGVLDHDLGLCVVERTSEICPLPYMFSPQEKKCVRVPFCLGGPSTQYSWNTETKKCEPINIEPPSTTTPPELPPVACAKDYNNDGQFQDNEYGECINTAEGQQLCTIDLALCDVDCPSGFVPQDGKCTFPPVCPAGTYYNSDLDKCVAPPAFKCGLNQNTYQDFNTCFQNCASLNCPSGAAYEPSTSMCWINPEFICLRNGQKYNDLQSCTSLCGQVGCPQGTIYKEDIDKCVEPHLYYNGQPIFYKDVFCFHWAYSYIKLVAQRGIMIGRVEYVYWEPNGLLNCHELNIIFSRLGYGTSGCQGGVEHDMLREEMAKEFVIAKVGDNFTYNTTPYYSDVPSSHPYFKYIQKAKELGLMIGYDNGTFGVGKTITRAETAIIVTRILLNQPGMTLSPQCVSGTSCSTVTGYCETSPQATTGDCQPLCPSGMRYNYQTNRCETTAGACYEHCPTGTAYNPTSGFCEASPFCPADCPNGTQYQCTLDNKIYETLAECNPSCYSFYCSSGNFNKQTRQCEISATYKCDLNGQTYTEMSACTSVCGSLTCPSGTQYNQQTGKCEADPTFSYQCSINGQSYPTQQDCQTACVQTANCNKSTSDLTFSATNATIGNTIFFFNVTTGDNTININTAIQDNNYSPPKNCGAYNSGPEVNYSTCPAQYIGGSYFYGQRSGVAGNVIGIVCGSGTNPTIQFANTLVGLGSCFNHGSVAYVNGSGATQGFIPSGCGTFPCTCTSYLVGYRIETSGGYIRPCIIQATNSSCSSYNVLSCGSWIKFKPTYTYICPFGGQYPCTGSPPSCSRSGTCAEQPTCPAGTQYNSQTGKCEATPQGQMGNCVPQCPQGMWYNYNTNICIAEGTRTVGTCKPICPAGGDGSTLDPNLDLCVISGKYSCPYPNRPCLKDLTDNQYKCSPIDCVSTTENAEDTEAEGLTNDAEVDDSGCLGTVYIFNGKEMRCRLSGLYTGFHNCCNKSQGKIYDSTGGGLGSLSGLKNMAEIIYAVYKAISLAKLVSNFNEAVTFAYTFAGPQAGRLVIQGAGVFTGKDAASLYNAFLRNGQISQMQTGSDTIFVTVGNLNIDALTGDIIYEYIKQSGLVGTVVSLATSLMIKDPILSSAVNLVAQAIFWKMGLVGIYGFAVAVFSFVSTILLMNCDVQDISTSTLNESGFCHQVGDSYCIKKIVRACVQKARRYCCFNSKLARIIHEQGRSQLTSFGPDGGWGTPKSPNCRGFLPEEFQALDFNKIDLSEYIEDIQRNIRQNLAPQLQQQIQQSWGQ
ncbi:MAG: conjugal transfer protein TraN [Candidatus Bathyarchaeia archaeon]